MKATTVPPDALPPINAPVIYAGMTGRVEKLTPKNLPEYAVVRFGHATKTLRLSCLVEHDGEWRHQYKQRTAQAERMRWKAKPIEEPAAVGLLMHHWDFLLTQGYTRESFTRLCEGNELTLREGYAEVVRKAEGK